MEQGEVRPHAFARRLRKQMSRAEILLWSYIRRRAMGGVKFRRQHPIGPYIADFACVKARLVIEVDGATHWTEAQVEHDARRTRYLEAEGWTVVRVSNADVYKDMDGVWRLIAGAIPPFPSLLSGLPPQAGEE